jgi:hypothetical protein
MGKYMSNEKKAVIVYRNPAAKLYTYRGNDYTLSELSRETGINKETLRWRLWRKQDIETACNPEKQSRKAKTVIKAFIKPTGKKKEESALDDSPDDFIIGSWKSISLSEQQNKRRNDAYEARVAREIAGKEFYE